MRYAKFLNWQSSSERDAAPAGQPEVSGRLYRTKEDAGVQGYLEEVYEMENGRIKGGGH